MNTTELKSRLAAMTAEMSRYDERLAHLSAIEKARAQAIDERDVALKDVEYWQARADALAAEVERLTVRATTAEVATQSTVGVEIDGKSRLYTIGELLELYVRVSNDLEAATTQLTKIGGVFEPSAPLSADAIMVEAMRRAWAANEF